MLKKNIRIGILFGLPLCFLIVVFLSGCLVPENFVASVRVDRKGNYDFKYDGIMAYLPVVAANKEGEYDKKMLKNLWRLAKK